MARTPKLAIWKFTSCDGCQLALLDCEAELLLGLGDTLEIAHFPEATTASVRGPYDISLVEGSITTTAEAAQVREIRARSRLLVTIGACATAGGIQALRNFAELDDYRAAVYPRPDVIDVLARSTPIAEHVEVDHELRGCPIGRDQLVETLAALLNGRAPDLPTGSVCAECKMAGAVCLMVAGGVPCLGPATQAGCGAICPARGRPCYGCFGPAERPNTPRLAELWVGLGGSAEDTNRAFRTFNAWAPAFRGAGEEDDD